MKKIIKNTMPYGYWMDRSAKLYPVDAEGGHADVALDLLGDKFLYILELGWVRVVCEKSKKTIFFEYGNTTRPSVSQMRKLKELAQDSDYKLVSENTGREVDIYESKVSQIADKILEAPPSGKPSWRSRYPLRKPL